MLGKIIRRLVEAQKELDEASAESRDGWGIYHERVAVEGLEEALVRELTQRVLGEIKKEAARAKPNEFIVGMGEGNVP